MPRTPPPPVIKQHLFNTGVLVSYRPISNWQRIQLAQRATRELRSEVPTPPVYHDDFGGAPTPNPSDPAYIAAMSEHQAKIGGRVFRWAAHMALVVDNATVADGLAAHQQEVDELAAFLAELPPEEGDTTEELDHFLEGASDKVRWLLLVAAGGDTMALTEWILKLYNAGLDMEAVADATEMFSRDVPRAEPVGPTPAAIGDADSNAGADMDSGSSLGERNANELPITA